MSKFITIKDTAKIIGVSKLTLRNWDNQGKLKAHRNPINNYRVYKIEEVENFIKSIETSPVIIRKKKDQIKKMTIKHL